MYGMFVGTTFITHFNFVLKYGPPQVVDAMCREPKDGGGSSELNSLIRAMYKGSKWTRMFGGNLFSDNYQKIWADTEDEGGSQSMGTAQNGSGK